MNTIKTKIVQACKHLYSKDLVWGFDGNISNKKLDGTFLVTSSGVCKKYIQESDIINVDKDGNKLSGVGKISTEFTTHLACYNERDIEYVVHAHPITATALTFSTDLLYLDQPIVPEVVSQIGKIPIVRYETPGSNDLALAVKDAILRYPDSNYFMLKQHGVIGIGNNLENIVMHIEKIEYLSRIISICNNSTKSSGNITTLTDNQIDNLNSYTR